MLRSVHLFVYAMIVSSHQDMQPKQGRGYLHASYLGGLLKVDFLGIDFHNEEPMKLGKMYLPFVLQYVLKEDNCQTYLMLQIQLPVTILS